MKSMLKTKIAPLAIAAVLIVGLAAGGMSMASAKSRTTTQKAAATASGQSFAMLGKAATSSAQKVATKQKPFYTFIFDVGYQAPGVPSSEVVKVKATPKYAFGELHRCFNCNFPVSGAPKAYPSEGQLINLRACFAGAICKKAPVKYYTVTNNSSFKLIAQKGHFDGKGSKITFTLYRDSKGYLKLKVVAYVLKPTVPNAANRQVAHDKWFDFATRLGTNIWVKCGNPCRK